MRVRCSAQAEEDLIEIWIHIARNNAVAADKILDRLDERWKLLVTQPRSGAQRDDLAPGIRTVATGEYLTFYRVEKGGIEIVRVLHGRRNITRDDFLN